MEALRHFPRTHLILAATLVATLAVVLIASARHPDPNATLLITSAPVLDPFAGAALELKPLAELTSALPDEADSGSEIGLSAQDIETSKPQVRKVTETVRSGDSLARIFSRQSLSPRTLHELMTNTPEAKRLKRIYPGHELHFVIDEDNQLQQLTYAFSRLEKLVIEANADGFKAKEIKREPETVLTFRKGEIRSSLFLAGQAADLDQSTILRFAQIFQWDIDFIRDIRTGDTFSLLYEEQYLDGEFIGVGRILAATFTNRGREHRAVRYDAEDGSSGYFTPEGRSVRRAFLRAPLEFTRVSSRFNPRRLHPIHNRAAPHRGIDYAAPTGTPVWAAGDGRVRTASRTEANGNYIVLQHGEQFQTKYLHLSRIARGIRPGAQVSQGQVIGYVGATGWATGPHLHYEFLVNGVHRDPATVSLPNADPVADSEMSRFLARSAPLLAMLDSEEQLYQLAARQ